MPSQDVLERADKIRLLVVDIDGVMTDGLLYFGAAGEALKSFHARDGLGLRLLMDHDIQVAIITGRQSEIVSVRAKDLKIQHVYQGRLDKKTALEELITHLDLNLSQVAYVGDDIIDLPVLACVGLAVGVKNSDEAIFPYCHFISRFKGGRGAVREVCNLILSVQNLMPTLLNQVLEGGALFKERQPSC